MMLYRIKTKIRYFSFQILSGLYLSMKTTFILFLKPAYLKVLLRLDTLLLRSQGF